MTTVLAAHVPRQPDRRAREAQLAGVRAAEEARQKAVQLERDKRDSVTYEKLLRELKDAKDTAGEVLAFAKNPFDKTAEAISNRITGELMSGVAASVLPNFA